MKIRFMGVVWALYFLTGLAWALDVDGLLEMEGGALLACSVVCLNWFRRDAKPDMVDVDTVDRVKTSRVAVDDESEQLRLREFRRRHFLENVFLIQSSVSLKLTFITMQWFLV